MTTQTDIPFPVKALTHQTGLILSVVFYHPVERREQRSDIITAGGLTGSLPSQGWVKLLW